MSDFVTGLISGNVFYFGIYFDFLDHVFYFGKILEFGTGLV